MFFLLKNLGLDICDLKIDKNPVGDHLPKKDLSSSLFSGVVDHPGIVSGRRGPYEDKILWSL